VLFWRRAQMPRLARGRRLTGQTALTVPISVRWGLFSNDPKVAAGLQATFPQSWEGWLMKLLGWILTTIAVSLGAPFWFDMLNKVMVIRATVKPTEKSPDEPPVDRR
jgi:hypothetical protein